MRRLSPPREELWAVPAPVAQDLRRSDPPSSSDGELRRFLSETDELEVLGVLREQFRHEQRITSDDVRFVVRAVASHGGAVVVPPDFPPTSWIFEFKRAHGFSQLGGNFAFGLLEHLNVGPGSRSSVSSGGSSDDERDCNERPGSHYIAAREPGAYAPFSTRPVFDSSSPLQQGRRQHQQQHQRRSMVVNDRRVNTPWQQRQYPCDREELGSNTSCDSFDSENGSTTGTSSSSSVSTSAGIAPPSSTSNNRGSYESSQDGSSTSKRGYKLSHTVPPETWEKAIAAVEQQGMSLRAAAKIYGVHFAALHRRVKKRAQGGQSAKGNNGYFHPSDEAGIMRVVVARAELGVLMTFDELMKLVETAALRKLPDISVENARKLMVRFQSRNEHSIRHIIVDWPPPPMPAVSSGASTASRYHLEHPGYDASTAATMQQHVVTRSGGGTDGTETAAAVAAAPPQLLPPSRNGSSCSSSINSTDHPVLPSMNAIRSPLRPLDSVMAPSPPTAAHLPQRVPHDQDSGRSLTMMFV